VAALFEVRFLSALEVVETAADDGALDEIL